MLFTEASAMLQDIAEEPALIALCCAQARSGTLTEKFTSLFAECSIRQVTLCGSGSVLCAARVLREALKAMLSVETDCFSAGALLYHEAFPSGRYAPKEQLLFCPAETGNSRGPVIAAQKARAAGIPVVCTSRSPDSPLARHSSVVIPKLSGTERARPSTKGYICGVLESLLCIAEAARTTGALCREGHARFLTEANGLAARAADRIRATADWFDAERRMLLVPTQYHVVGYGVNTATAAEGALKLIEAGRRTAAAYELEEFLHGPLGALAPEDTPILLFAEEGEEKETMSRLYHVLRAVTPRCIAIGAVPESLRGDPLCLPFDPGQDPFLGALQLVIPLQVTAAKLADGLGQDTTTCRNPAARQAMCTDYRERDKTGG